MSKNNIRKTINKNVNNVIANHENAENENEYVCPICGKRFKGYGNNPRPVKKEGRCCDECNRNVVIPARNHCMRLGVGW